MTPIPTLSAVQQIRPMRGGSPSHLMRASDGYYVTKFQNNPQHGWVSPELIAADVEDAAAKPDENKLGT